MKTVKAKAAAKKPAKKTVKARPQKQFYETSFRIKRDQKEELQKKGLHVYSRRDNGRDDTIEPSVAVDFVGSIITNFPIKFPKTGPSANMILRGNSYLKEKKAERVYRLDDLKPTRRKKK